MPSATDFLNEPETAPSASAFLEEEPTVTVTQPEGGDGFLAKVNAALRKPSPAWLQAPEAATRELVGGMVPHDLPSYLASLSPPVAMAKQAADVGAGLVHGDVSGIPLVGRIPEIAAAEDTPAGSKERYLTAMKTLMDVGMLAGGGERAPLPLRGEPLATPELPPSPNLGPGTIAGDVSKALERQQAPPPVPPEAPVQVPEVPATASEATVPTQVPVKQAYDDLSKQHYEAVSQLQSAEQSGTATEEMYSAVQESERKVIAAEDALEKAGWRQGKTPQDEWDYLPPTPQPVTPPVDVAALQKRKAAIEASIAPSKAIGQRTAYDEELAGINGQLGVPPEGPVNAPGGATVAPETPGGVPVADIPPEDVKYAGGEPVPQAATEPVGGNVAGFEKTYGPGEIPAGETLLPEEAFAKAQARMASGVAKPYSFVARAKTGAITPTEMGDLVAEHDRLINEAAAREGTPEYDGAYQAAKDFATNILKPAETAWHQKGMVMQIKAPVDYSRLTGFRQAMEKRIGREMTPTEAPAFQEAANDVAKSEGEAQVAQKASIERVQKHFSKTPDVAFEDAASAMHKQIEELTRPCIL